MRQQRKKPDMRRRAACKELARQGFIRDPGWPNGITMHGQNTLLFTKQVGDRQLDVQLEIDGTGRMSHFLQGRMSTHPTYFVDIASMLAAIQTELTRTDHLPTDPKAIRRITKARDAGLRHCHACGCTEDDCRHCIEKTGEPCRWVGPTLCSACAP